MWPIAALGAADVTNKGEPNGGIPRDLLGHDAEMADALAVLGSNLEPGEDPLFVDPRRAAAANEAPVNGKAPEPAAVAPGVPNHPDPSALDGADRRGGVQRTTLPGVQAPVVANADHSSRGGSARNPDAGAGSGFPRDRQDRPPSSPEHELESSPENGRAYYGPRPPPARARHATFDMQAIRVRPLPFASSNEQPTQKSFRRADIPIASVTREHDQDTAPTAPIPAGSLSLSGSRFRKGLILAVLASLLAGLILVIGYLLRSPEPPPPEVVVDPDVARSPMGANTGGGLDPGAVPEAADRAPAAAVRPMAAAEEPAAAEPSVPPAAPAESGSGAPNVVPVPGAQPERSAASVSTGSNIGADSSKRTLTKPDPIVTEPFPGTKPGSGTGTSQKKPVASGTPAPRGSSWIRVK